MPECGWRLALKVSNPGAYAVKGKDDRSLRPQRLKDRRKVEVENGALSPVVVIPPIFSGNTDTCCTDNGLQLVPSSNAET